MLVAYNMYRGHTVCGRLIIDSYIRHSKPTYLADMTGTISMCGRVEVACFGSSS